tara:strand:- start:801 stop:1088 length:288 start_codon:yes stop_codon:yes gene_type:complete
MWLLVLVMIGVDSPNIMTVPLEKYESQEVCYDKLIERHQQAQDDSGQAALVCLKDPRVAEPVNDRKFFDEGIDDSLIIAKRSDMVLEPGIIMKGV